MAKIFFGFDNNNSILQKELFIKDEDTVRILAYLMQSSYGKVTENVQTSTPDMSWTPSEEQTEADRPVLFTQQWVTRQATPEEAMQNYAKMVVNNLLNETVSYETSQAVQSAASAVKPIPVVE